MSGECKSLLTTPQVACLNLFVNATLVGLRLHPLEVPILSSLERAKPGGPKQVFAG
jgi:hypothetical protein